MANYTTLASLGQKYQDYPAASFDERFGPYNARPDQEMMRQLLEQEMRRQQEQQRLQQVPESIIPGQPTIDELGHRGVRHPSGYYMLKAI